MNDQRTVGRRPKKTSLSQEAVTQAAIEILDEYGEAKLTFRVLADRLNTGAGAIYWHVAGRHKLLDLACDAVLSGSGTDVVEPTADGDDLASIRAVALALFDTLDRHPWIGMHLSSSPGLPSAYRLLDRIGVLLVSFGMPARRQFYIATAIFTYVIGTAVLMTRNAQSATPTQSQKEWLADQSEHWRDLDPEVYPFLHSVAQDFRGHDDRDQFTTGLDLLLAGVRSESRA